MIRKNEILVQAKKHQLTVDMIEKDYVLSWVLAGISHSKHLKDSFIFKGGTCLKKCYFEEYRFSEDLDFTVTQSELMNAVVLKDIFQEISEWVYEESGVVLIPERIKFEEYQNPRGGKSIEGRVNYIGPMNRTSSYPAIKIDLTADEQLVEVPVLCSIYHSYSDELQVKVKAYSIEEVFAEKIRALAERMRPRDLYDVVNIFQYKSFNLNKEKVLKILKAKCRYKKMLPPTMDSIDQDLAKQELISDWDNMLKHQIAGLDVYQEYWEKLPGFFDWLYS